MIFSISFFLKKVAWAEGSQICLHELVVLNTPEYGEVFQVFKTKQTSY